MTEKHIDPEQAAIEAAADEMLFDVEIEAITEKLCDLTMTQMEEVHTFIDSMLCDN